MKRQKEEVKGGAMVGEKGEELIKNVLLKESECMYDI